MSTNIETAMLSIVYPPPPTNRLYCLTFKSWHICLTSGKNDQKWDNEVEIDKQQPIWKFEITKLSQALPQATANEILILSRFLLWIDNMVTTTTGTILQDHHPRGLQECKVRTEEWKWGDFSDLAAPQTPKLPPLLPLSLVTSRPTSVYYVSSLIPWICSLKNWMKL